MADEQFTESQDAYPLEHVQILCDEMAALKETERAAARWRERLLADMRHAIERVRMDLGWDAQEAARRIPEAIAAGDADTAAQLTAVTITAHRISRMTLEESLRAVR